MNRKQSWEQLRKNAIKVRFGYEDLTFISIKTAQAVKAFGATKKS